MVIKQLAEDKSRICRMVLAALPVWFGIPEAIDSYCEDVQRQPLFAASDGEQTIGFLALELHNPYTAEIHVMGILPAYQRRGIGRSLLEASEEYCRECGKVMLLVKTLDSSHPDIYYARTREFYLAMGFVPLQVLEGYWGESNPCLLMGKPLCRDVNVPDG